MGAPNDTGGLYLWHVADWREDWQHSGRQGGNQKAKQQVGQGTQRRKKKEGSRVGSIGLGTENRTTWGGEGDCSGTWGGYRANLWCACQKGGLGVSEEGMQCIFPPEKKPYPEGLTNGMKLARKSCNVLTRKSIKGKKLLVKYSSLNSCIELHLLPLFDSALSYNLTVLSGSSRFTGWSHKHTLMEHSYMYSMLKKCAGCRRMLYSEKRSIFGMKWKEGRRKKEK